MTSDTFRVKLKRQLNGWSEDLTMRNFTFNRLKNRNVVEIFAATNVIEDPRYQTEPSTVHILYEEIPDSIEIIANEIEVEYTFLTIIQHEHEGVEPTFEMLIDSASIFEIHKQKWKQFWEDSGITVNGNDELSTSIHASIYAIASSLPSLDTPNGRDAFYGLSPSGLGVGGPKLDGYRGHGFWDTETWMLPAIMLLEPQWSRELLNYRFLLRNAAQMNANETDYKGIRSVTKAEVKMHLFYGSTPQISYEMLIFISF